MSSNANTDTRGSGLHLYTRPDEPATRYNAGAPIGRVIWIRNNPRRLMRCIRCERRRWAANLSVQVYFDMVRVFCANRERCYRERKGAKRDRRK